MTSASSRRAWCHRRYWRGWCRRTAPGLASRGRSSRASEAIVNLAMSWPSMVTLPRSGSKKRKREIDQRAFARAGRSDQRHGASRGGTTKLTPLSTTVLGLIGERDVVELDLAALQREGLASAASKSRVCRSMMPNTRLAAATPSCSWVCSVAALFSGRVKQQRRGHEAHEMAEREVAADALGAGEIDGEREAEVRSEARSRGWTARGRACRAW